MTPYTWNRSAKRENERKPVTVIHVTPDKKSDAFFTGVIPALAGIIPMFGGYIIAVGQSPITTFIGFMAACASAAAFRLMALDWRDTRIANTALCLAAKNEATPTHVVSVVADGDTKR